MLCPLMRTSGRNKLEPVLGPRVPRSRRRARPRAGEAFSALDPRTDRSHRAGNFVRSLMQGCRVHAYVDTFPLAQLTTLPAGAVAPGNPARESSGTARLRKPSD